jgi:hypothetical protein
LSLNLSPNARKSRDSLLNSLIAGKSRGDGRDQHCGASQAFRRSAHHLENCQKSPPMAGFCDPAGRLWTPKFTKSEANHRKSPGLTANIPVFGRLAPETVFETHCMARAAVKFAVFSTSGAAILGAVSHVLPPDLGALPRSVFPLSCQSPVVAPWGARRASGRAAIVFSYRLGDRRCQTATASRQTSAQAPAAGPVATAG